MSLAKSCLTLDHRPLGVFRDVAPALEFAEKLRVSTGEDHCINQPVKGTFCVHHAEALHEHLDLLESLSVKGGVKSVPPSTDLTSLKKKSVANFVYIGGVRVPKSGKRTTSHEGTGSRGFPSCQPLA